MLNLAEVLFCVFGWIYDKPRFLITAICISAIFLLMTLWSEGNKAKLAKIKGEKHEPEGRVIGAMAVQLTCLVLSIIKLCV